MNIYFHFVLSALVLPLGIFLTAVSASAAPALEETLRILENKDYRFEQELIIQTYEESENNDQKVQMDLVLVLYLNGHQYRKMNQGIADMASRITNTINGKSYITNTSHVFEIISHNKLNFIKLLGYSFDSEFGNSVFAKNIESYFNDIYESKEYFRMIDEPSSSKVFTDYISNNFIQIAQKALASGIFTIENVILPNGQKKVIVGMNPKIEKRNVKKIRAFYNKLLSLVPDNTVATDWKEHMESLSDEEFSKMYELVLTDLEAPLFDLVILFDKDLPVNFEISFSPYLIGFSSSFEFKNKIFYESVPNITIPNTRNAIIQDDFYAPVGDKDLKIISLDESETDDYETIVKRRFIEITQLCKVKNCSTRVLRKLQGQLPAQHMQTLKRKLNEYYKKGIVIPLV